MAWLFNFAYLAAIVLASPWLLYSAIRHGKYRHGWSKKLFGRVPRRESSQHCVWLHAVSVGEVNLLDTILGRIESEYPQCDVVISTTTAAGYALAKKKYAPRTIFYAPLDFTWAVRAALKRIRPDVLILTELEVWPNLVRAAKQRGVKVTVVNGRLSERSFRGYRRLAWMLRSTFERIDLVAAQTEEYAERFRALGCAAEHVYVTGSLKFDGARSDRNNPNTRHLAALAGITEDDIVFLAGSTQAPEESLALDAFERYASEHPRLKLILVPRHPERFAEVADLLDRSGLPWQRRSELEKWGGLPACQDGSERTAGWKPTPRILLVDAVGELKDWWGLAAIAFVGGSMGSRGGQNMIEPAAYGAAVSFGPNTWNFRDVVAQLLAGEAAVVIHSGEELARFVGHCLVEPHDAEVLGQRAAQIVVAQQGAATRTMDLLVTLMDHAPASSQLRVDAQQPLSRPSRTTPSISRRAS